MLKREILADAIKVFLFSLKFRISFVRSISVIHFNLVSVIGRFVFEVVD